MTKRHTRRKHERTLAIISWSHAMLSVHRPMTVKQLFYRLVANNIVKNDGRDYRTVSYALLVARQQGQIPWGWIANGSNVPRPSPAMWDGLPDFTEHGIKTYRRNFWPSQPRYIEVWLEKGSLAGIFQRVLAHYAVILNVGRSKDGWELVFHAAERIRKHRTTTILDFSDFDAAEKHPTKWLTDRLDHFGCHPEIVCCALTADDVVQSSLPPDFSVAGRSIGPDVTGERPVELEALSPDLLVKRIRTEIESRLDMDAVRAIQQIETEERARLGSLLVGLSYAQAAA